MKKYLYLKRYLVATSLFFLVISTGLSSNAQSIDLANIAKAKPLVVSGGVGVNGIFTAGLPENPFNYFVNANLNFNIFGTVNVPLNFNYSNRRISLSQGFSFNQLSISPTYKWATAHLGTNYMTFSPYTLNGHQFVGAGLELTPDKWKIQLMNGRLIKGQFQDSTITGPTFRRMGYGAKVEYNPGQYLVGVTVFKAYDVASSVPQLQRTFEGTVVNPKDNMVVSLNAGTTLFHALQLSVEYANSVITKDQQPEYERIKINSLAGFLHRGNATSESFNALKARANYNIAASQTIVGVGYERIDPNYSTLGGYYFVNDLANYTVNASQVLYQGKVNLGGNFGIQQDDIKKTRANRQSRYVGSLNANANLNNGLSMGLNFSNFQSYRFLNDTYSQITRIPGQVVDTLDYALVSRTLGYNLNKVLSSTESKQTAISLNANLIGSQSKLANVVDGQSKTNIINSSVTYSMAFPAKKAAISTSLTFFRNEFFNNSLVGIGPTVSFQKTFFEKLNTNLNVAAINVRTDRVANEGEPNSLALNSQLSANARVGKNHNFNFNTGVVKTNGATFLNGNIGYNYSF